MVTCHGDVINRLFVTNEPLDGTFNEKEEERLERERE